MGQIETAGWRIVVESKNVMDGTPAPLQWIAAIRDEAEACAAVHKLAHVKPSYAEPLSQSDLDGYGVRDGEVRQR
jgi:hypothetical protein